MNKDLPNYVFENEYDHFYLFTEFDIIFNDQFSEKLITFINTKQSNELIIKLELSEENKVYLPEILKYPKPLVKDLDNFYELNKNVNGNDLYYYMINHYISDNSYLWEIYVSLENELCVFGCKNEINSLFNVIFNPYIEESLEQKYKIISDMFIDEKSKKEFINSLEQNYYFAFQNLANKGK